VKKLALIIGLSLVSVGCDRWDKTTRFNNHYTENPTHYTNANKFEHGDYVRITYGEYCGTTGTVIGYENFNKKLCVTLKVYLGTLKTSGHTHIVVEPEHLVKIE
jgi:ribosomal protein L21E